MDYNNIFSDPVFENKYQRIKAEVLEGKTPVSTPVSVVLGGLPGAGKSNIYSIYDERTDDNIVHIDCDAFRQYHPDAKSFAPEEYAEKTRDFVSAVSDRLVYELSSEKYNIIFESPLKNTHTAFWHTELLKPLGYNVVLAVMGTNSDEARKGTIDRYNEAKEKYEAKIKAGITNAEPPRPVSKEFFDYVDEHIVESLNLVYNGIDEEGKQHTPVDDIYIFTRNRDAVYHKAETPDLSPAEILDARLKYTEEEAEEIIGEHYRMNKLPYQKRTSIKTFSKFGGYMLNQMALNPETYRDYMKYQGRLFKLPTSVTLEFYAQKPEAKFMATREQWEKIGYSIKKGEIGTRFVDNGSFKDYYDFSQTKQAKQPAMWTITQENAAKVKAELGIAEDESIISGLIKKKLEASTSDISDCMERLGVANRANKDFRKAYINAVMLIMAGRLEVGGNKFEIPPDQSIMPSLDTNEKRFEFISSVKATAKGFLDDIEHAITKIAFIESIPVMNKNEV